MFDGLFLFRLLT